MNKADGLETVFRIIEVLPVISHCKFLHINSRLVKQTFSTLSLKFCDTQGFLHYFSGEAKLLNTALECFFQRYFLHPTSTLARLTIRFISRRQELLREDPWRVFFVLLNLQWNQLALRAYIVSAHLENKNTESAPSWIGDHHAPLSVVGVKEAGFLIDKRKC